MTVDVRPLPDSYRKFSPRWRPRPPPIFPGGDPSPADIDLARALFLALDDESKRWYKAYSTFADLMPD